MECSIPSASLYCKHRKGKLSVPNSFSEGFKEDILSNSILRRESFRRHFSTFSSSCKLAISLYADSDKIFLTFISMASSLTSADNNSISLCILLSSSFEASITLLPR
uniref:Uncharacterized protein n=1 Tax=Opuntia streptacantha TaxID=393608 RepID=A0A7C9A508_OPUST